MRLFVSTPVPHRIKEDVLQRAKELLGEKPLRWLPPENLHLTLKFLGEVEEKHLSDLQRALSETASRHTRFEISLAGLGAFPGERRTRVVWAGVETDAPELRRLAADIEQSLYALGYEKEHRPYTPHLTLARVRRRPLSLELKGIDLKTEAFETRRFELMASILEPGGASYHAIEQWPLEGE